ncbi:MAG: amidase [Galactobacter sp.]|uniref:amidase n=1 Tax=Galactobacter sp. TaxID=2676125 RepID=UPI0025C12BA7|nr:amidase [Galactobacter sp.]
MAETTGTLRGATTDVGASAAELTEAYRTGETTPSAVLEAILEDIEARNGIINAFSDITADGARAAAAVSTQRWSRGEPISDLDGVPVTVKENMKRVGVVAYSGSLGAVEETTERDSPIVERFTEAGAVIVGSTTMPDWGMLSSGVSSRHGVTRSPLDPALTVGGSSSGAGAAAAAGWGAIHMGSDIGGSVRLPATWLGLATLKPSEGRIPIDTPYLGRAAGPIARSVDEVALAMAHVTRPDSRDYTSMPYQDIAWAACCESQDEVRGKRIALHTEAGAGMAVDPEVAATVRAAGELFAAAGADVVEIPAFVHEADLVDLDSFWRVRFWRTYSKLDAAARAAALPFIQEWVMKGADVPGSEALRCYDGIGSFRARTVRATEGFDAVLSPVAPQAAFPAEWPMPWGFEDRGMEHIAFTVPYNMSGQPAASVNAGFTSDGRSIGLQIAGARFDDVGVLKLAKWFEEHRPTSAVPEFAQGV